MSHGSRPPLRALTSVRLFAALYVVLFHCNLPLLLPLPSLAIRFMGSGYTGVTLFFSLSGFILAYNYPAVQSRRTFWAARFARIYPVYAVSLFLSMALTLSHSRLSLPPQLPGAALLSILLLQSWIPAYATILNSVAWTLSTEVFFCASFPSLNLYCRNPRHLVFRVFAATYLILVVSPIALSHHDPARALFLGRMMEGTIPIFRLGTFIIGMYAGAEFTRGRRFSALLPVSLVCTLFLLLWTPSDLGRPLKTMLLSYAFTGVLCALATIQSGPLTNRWLLLGGEISYSIYLIQFIVLRASRGTLTRLFPSHNFDTATFILCIFLPSLMFISYLSFRFIEVPARRYIRRLSA